MNPGTQKVSDFGLSAFFESKRQDGLLHTTCGTPAYVAPEVINKRGYDGEKADIWSCGMVLFVLLAGYLPFHDSNIMEMYRKISRGEFKCPQWFPPEVKKLLSRILDPNPYTRMTLAKLMENSWFKKGFKQIEIPKPITTENISTLRSVLDVENAIIETISECGSYKDLQESARSSSPSSSSSSSSTMRPTSMNAFDIISLSQGFDLSGLFEKDMNHKPESRFTTRKPASTIVSKFEEVAMMESFKVKKKDKTVKLEGSKEGRKGTLAIDAEIFEVTPSFHVVEVKKAAGDTIEYQNFCDHELKPSLKDIVWAWQGKQQQLQHQQPQL